MRISLQELLFKLLRVLPPLIVLTMATISLCTLGNYLFYDTIADVHESAFKPIEEQTGKPDGFVNRPPLNQLLLEAIAYIFPPEKRLLALSILQHLFILLEVLMIQSFFKARGQTALGLFAALFWALNGKTYLLAQISQTESLYTFLLMLWLWLVSRWWYKKKKKGGLKAAILCGAAMGLLPATRTVSMIALILLAFAWLYGKGENDGKRKPIIQLIAALSTAILVILAFMTINSFRLGRFSLVDEKGLHLLSRIVSEGETQLPDKPASRKIIALAKKHNIDLYKRESLWGVRDGEKGELGEYFTTDQLMTDAAMEAIKAKPLHYFWGNILNIVRSTGKDNAEWNVPVGMSNEYFDFHGNWWKKRDIGVERLGKVFPSRRQEPLFGEAGYTIIKGLTDTFWSNLWRGWWVTPALFLIGIYCLRLRDPIFILTLGMAAGTIFIACSAETYQHRFWDACLLPFMLSVFMALSYLSKSVEKYELSLREKQPPDPHSKNSRDAEELI